MERFEFVARAFQYYVVARHAVFCQFMPVAGNLFHHAVELFLKMGILLKFAENQLQKEVKRLKDGFGHDLTKLWDEFKKVQSDPSLSQFDSALSQPIFFSSA